MLMESAVGESGEGNPAVLKVNHKALEINHQAGIISFENGVQANHDLIVGADGIGSSVRRTLGIIPDRKQSTSRKISTSSVFTTTVPMKQSNPGVAKVSTRLSFHPVARENSIPSIVSSQSKRPRILVKDGVTRLAWMNSSSLSERWTQTSWPCSRTPQISNPGGCLFINHILIGSQEQPVSWATLPTQ
jgi:2-polyprenyl-6-methoxyphenol hydroxylase-like FAD-dependent oxidoreductase